MRRFLLRAHNPAMDRMEILADGVLFIESGKLAVCWRGPHTSMVTWDSLESFTAVSVPAGRRVIWIDEEGGTNAD